MNRELIERLAKEAGLFYYATGVRASDDKLRKFASLVAEECAKECDEWRPLAGSGGAHVNLCARSIRAKFPPPT